MVNNGYTTQTSYTNTTAGNFAVVSNDSHVVLITINDGSRIAYTGHTTDERDTVISNYSGYRFYVIKNF